MTTTATTDVILKAGEILKAGGLVAFPTETVYGLGANALEAQAAKKIYKAKGRPSDNPLIVHIADFDALSLIAADIPQKACDLAEKYWPGPLTMIFPKTDVVPSEITGGLKSVAVRMPNHPVALALIAAGGGYIAAPSANTSGRPSPTSATHVESDLGDCVDMIIDGGENPLGLESTIIDFTSDEPTILRPGYITKAMIEDIIGPVKAASEKLINVSKDVPKAPGMKYTHYAPRAPLYIIVGEEAAVTTKINDLAAKDIESGKQPGIICSDENISTYQQGKVKSLGDRADEESIARHLYGILREFDDTGVSVIYSEEFDTPNLGDAIMNRLKKAAGHKIIEA